MEINIKIFFRSSNEKKFVFLLVGASVAGSLNVMRKDTANKREATANIW